MNLRKLVFNFDEATINNNKKYFFIIFFIFISVISLTGLNGSLQNVDECLYATVARETFQSKTLIPLKEGKPYLHKSPILFWSIMLSYKMFGVNDFAAKLPSAIANIITSLMILLISRELFNSYLSGLIAVFIYNCSLQVNASAHQVAIDSLMIMTTLLSVFFLLKGLFYKRAWFFLAAIFNGMTFLTKSAMGFVVPVTFFIYMITQKRWKIIPYFILYMIISLGIAAPYFLHVFISYPENFKESFLWSNIISRFYPEKGFGMKDISRIIIAMIKYVIFLLLFTLPFTPGVVYMFLKKAKSIDTRELFMGEKSIFLTIYFLIVYSGFCISSAKGVWPHYTVPMLPAVVIFLAQTLINIKKRNILIYLASFSLLVLIIFLILVKSQIHKYPTYLDVVIGLSIIYTIFITANIILFSKKLENATSILFISSIFFISFTISSAITVPLDFNADIKSFSELKIDKAKPLVIINTNEVNEGKSKRRPVFWYLEMKSKQYNTFDQFINHKDEIDHGTYLIFYKGYTEKLKELYNTLNILKTGKIWNIAIRE